MKIKEEMESIIDRYWNGEYYADKRICTDNSGNEVELHLEDELRNFCTAKDVTYKIRYALREVDLIPFRVKRYVHAIVYFDKELGELGTIMPNVQRRLK